MISYYAVKLNDFQMEICNKLCSLLKDQSISSGVSNFTYLSLEELAELSKTNIDALNEYIKRTYYYVHILARSFAKKYNNLFDYSELTTVGINTCINILKAYDRTKGKLSHFLTKSIKRSLHFYAVKEINKEKVKQKNIGNKVEPTLENENKFFVGSNFENSELLKIDIENYIKTLSSINASILVSYLEGEKLVDIAKKLNISPSITFFRLKNIIKSLRVYLNPNNSLKRLK